VLNASLDNADKFGKHHLWFYFVNNKLGRCGEVDAAPLMPKSLFEPRNLLELAAYAEATTKLYTTSFGNGYRGFGGQNYVKVTVKLGRCADVGYVVRHGLPRQPLLRERDRPVDPDLPDGAGLRVQVCDCVWPTVARYYEDCPGKKKGYTCQGKGKKAPPSAPARNASSAPCAATPRATHVKGGCGAGTISYGYDVAISLYYKCCPKVRHGGGASTRRGLKRDSQGSSDGGCVSTGICDPNAVRQGPCSKFCPTRAASSPGKA